jgi:hypothetical protein
MANSIDFGSIFMMLMMFPLLDRLTGLLGGLGITHSATTSGTPNPDVPAGTTTVSQDPTVLEKQKELVQSQTAYANAATNYTNAKTTSNKKDLVKNTLAFGGAGAVLGAGVGLLGGPFAEVSVPAGALVGGGIGALAGGLYTFFG